eukprot:gnl/TRDRNA2_/TRDRNA2_185161_c0_seq1.p1 gnl/TRDRNA2_/TRDRNA2_185161_c0~~gnl/TRDRNA2_/TRDRNA2_185161_c0_seq1.p1  ORF type:complete len:194 (-),score=48.98 gnl/TRDRNA2_/TRDRNA2_185161_c0_seq1:189-770(-)
MGGCESCASNRRKEAQEALNQSLLKGDINELKVAIEKAEACGIDALNARKKYSDMAKMERQAPERVQEMLRWAMAMGDGVMLHAVINEVQNVAPNHEELRVARQRLAEHQDDTRMRLQRLAKNRDVRGMALTLDRARHMGIPAADLYWAEQHLRVLEAAQPSKVPRSLEAETTPRGSQASENPEVTALKRNSQ